MTQKKEKIKGVPDFEGTKEIMTVNPMPQKNLKEKIIEILDSLPYFPQGTTSDKVADQILEVMEKEWAIPELSKVKDFWEKVGKRQKAEQEVLEEIKKFEPTGSYDNMSELAGKLMAHIKIWQKKLKL